MKTIFRRSFYGFLVVIVILAVLAPLLIFNTIKSKLNTIAVSNLTRSAEALEYTLAPMIHEETAVLDSIVDELGNRMQMRITLISRDGTVLADSEEDPDSMESHRTRPEVICAFNGTTGIDTRRSATLGREMLYVAVPFQRDDTIPVVVRTSFFFEEQNAILQGIFVDIAIVMGVVLLAGIVLAWFSSGSIAKPIRAMAQAMRDAGKGDYEVRIPPCSITELNNLSSDINGMIARTDELITELSENNASLDAILRSLVGGLLVIDSDGRVVTANRSFRRMAGAGDRPEGVNYLDFITVDVFREFISNVLEDDYSSQEIEADGRFYSARAAGIEETDQYVVTFRDVTDTVQTVRMKREFAANASHELRTPLTSIKGYAETVMDGLSGEQKRYMKTILRNTDRLIRIVDDMRVLSELEHPMTTLDLSEVNFADVVTDTVELFRKRAEAKGLDLLIETEGASPVVRADRFRVEQVLINLIENAVKYTSSGRVTVRVAGSGSYITVVVSDTGTGIPEEHLNRLFERFYVVDKARSRSRGGTGLGLAIVKHIMTLHDGWVRVSSEEGSGTMFTVGFPRR